MNKIAFLIVAIVFGFTIPVSSTQTSYSGFWKSDEVQLVRGSLREAYFFTITFAHDADHTVMDLRYFDVENPKKERVIRQNVTLSSTHKHSLILTGSNPKLVSGPATIGVYEPDTLFCTTIENLLQCDWGSDAHGVPPKVTLRPTAN